MYVISILKRIKTQILVSSKEEKKKSVLVFSYSLTEYKESTPGIYTQEQLQGRKKKWFLFFKTYFKYIFF